MNQGVGRLTPKRPPPKAGVLAAPKLGAGVWPKPCSAPGQLVSFHDESYASSEACGLCKLSTWSTPLEFGQSQLMESLQTAMQAAQAHPVTWRDSFNCLNKLSKQWEVASHRLTERRCALAKP